MEWGPSPEVPSNIVKSELEPPSGSLSHCNIRIAASCNKVRFVTKPRGPCPIFNTLMDAKPGALFYHILWSWEGGA